MHPIIKASSELRKNYNAVAELCRQQQAPVFLTKNGKGDMVLMDLNTYSRREEELDTAARLLEAERSRLAGEKWYSVEEFRQHMLDAIAEGAKHSAKNK
ncbi:MAG: type II toxin-antitoxin system Phd/YefM family antitoxin [Candidatus Margulisbacteria bacterium]|jgi:PHD/YefM family antitoxin component YafN of YafNO toxin-antitoxin module|nr:type II toxin-antitoxin system Phd/YefM family antitoxin [Candidatus Margulisiibacteriota bacterium]